MALRRTSLDHPELKRNVGLSFHLAVCDGLEPGPGLACAAAAWPSGPAGTLAPCGVVPPEAC